MNHPLAPTTSSEIIIPKANRWQHQYMPDQSCAAVVQFNASGVATTTYVSQLMHVSEEHADNRDYDHDHQCPNLIRHRKADSIV